MVRSRSYNAATRSRSISSIRSRNPYAISNAFINVNPHEVEEVSDGKIIEKPKGTEWPTALRTVAVKDNITTLDLPTTCASSTLKSHISPFEATVVEILRSVGAKVQGKTNLDEFGMGSHSVNSFFGPVHKDLIQRYSVGGSSGGSAIAVAEKVSQFALGTDTGGSVRLPAAYTGVVGYKPSYGLISRRGVVPYANSLDTVGILAPDATNLHHVLRHVRQHDDQDPTSVTSNAWERISPQLEPTGLSEADYFANLTIGFPVEYNIEELEPSILQTWRRTLSLLRKKGCKIVPVSLPSTKHALSAYYVLAPAEAASNLSKYDGVRYGTREATSDGAEHVLYSETRGAGFGDEVKRRILLGSYTLSATAIDNYFVKAQKVRRLVQRDFDRVFKKENPLLPPQQFDISDMHESIPLQNKLGPSQVDFIICPTAPTLPPTLGDAFNQTGVDSYMNDVFTVPASLAGLPAISIPYTIPERFQEKDLPIVAGMQIIGQYGDDFRMLELSEKLDLILNPLHQPPKLKTDHLGEDALEKKQVKMDNARTKKSIRNPTSKGPRVSRYFLERAPKELLSKHFSERGEYHRKTLTENEAGNMLLDGFDEWLGSNQGRNTHTSAMIDQQRKTGAMKDRGSAMAKRKTDVLSNGSQEHSNELLDFGSDARVKNTSGSNYLEDIDDLGGNETESVSWDEAVRSSELDAFKPGPGFVSRVISNPAEYEDPEQQRTKQQNSNRIFDEIPQPEKTADRNSSFKTTRKQHSAKTLDKTQNSTSWNPTPPQPAGLDKKDNRPTSAPVTDSWTRLMEAVYSPPSKQKQNSKSNKKASTFSHKKEDTPSPQANNNWRKLLESFEKPSKAQPKASTPKRTGAARRRNRAAKGLSAGGSLDTFPGGGGAKDQDILSDRQTGTEKNNAGTGNTATVGGTSWWNPFT